MSTSTRATSEIEVAEAVREASLLLTHRHKSTRHQAGHKSDLIHPQAVDQNCFSSCYANCLQQCFDLPGWSKSACVSECRLTAKECREACTTTPCIPTTVCYPDRATTDPRCQICYKNNCDGTASVWHTC